jgi:hypothetical protein
MLHPLREAKVADFVYQSHYLALEDDDAQAQIHICNGRFLASLSQQARLAATLRRIQ